MSGFSDKWSFLVIPYEFNSLAVFMMFQFLRVATASLASSKRHGRLARWIKWRACDVGEVKEGLENELWRRWSNGRIEEWAHSPTFPSLHLRHNSFSNPSVALPTSQLILKPFRCFTYVTVHPPTLLSLHLINLASRPWFIRKFQKSAKPSFSFP